MKQTIKRLFKYQKIVKQFYQEGYTRIFSGYIAKELGVSSSQVRKDFSLLSIPGQKRGGYHLISLDQHIDKIINSSTKQQSICIGMGKIGQALANYHGFKDEGIEIVAGFDIRADIDCNIPVHDISTLEIFLRNHNIKVAVLAVPDKVAKPIAVRLEQAGILGLLNFTGSDLLLSEHIVVKNVNLELKLKNIFYYVEHQKKRPQIPT